MEMQGLEKHWWWGGWGTHQHEFFLSYDCAKTNYDYVHSFLKGKIQVSNVISVFFVVILLVLKPLSSQKFWVMLAMLLKVS